MNDKPHPAAIDVDGSWYMRDAKRNLVPFTAVKAGDLLMDETVRSMIDGASALSAAIAAFRLEAFARVAEFQGLLSQEYGAARGGAKGNVTLLSVDGCLKVQVQVADLIDFGPELQAAKAIIDELLTEWSATSGDELRAIVHRAFDVDKAGQISHTALLMLLRTNIRDLRWLRAMDAIRDSMRVVGSRSYVRFYARPAPDEAWRGISLDIASA